MTDPTDPMVERIRKLLAKAEAKGATDEERDAFNAKATSLMIKYAVDQALLDAADAMRLNMEKIITRNFVFAGPKSYSYELTCIGIRVAEALGCKGLLCKSYTDPGRTFITVVGFETDVEHVLQLAASLVLQAQLALAPWYADNVRPWHNGTDKFNIKRSFLIGFGQGIKDKFELWRKAAVTEAGTGAEVALRSRETQVTDWMDENMRTGKARGRRYNGSASAGGYGAGQRADIGGARVGGVRKQIGG